MQLNIKKCFFAKDRVEYLGFIVSREGIKPIPEKVKKMIAIKPPKTKKELRRFIGMINYYKDMYKKRAEILAPLTKMTGKNVPYKWDKECQESFDKIKGIIAKQTMLVFPDYNKPFVVYTDASDYQLGGVVTQEGKPVAFFSRKLNSAQKKYTTTDKELLSIVETLKEFKKMLYGQNLTVMTDHKNLTHPTTEHSSDRVLRQRLMIEEYGANIVYLRGENNVVADALSRLPYESELPIEQVQHECMMINAEDEQLTPPFEFRRIDEEQRKCPELKELKKAVEKRVKQQIVSSDHTLWMIKSARGPPNEDYKIYVPVSLREDLMQWYHENLNHPGLSRMKMTIGQHFR